MRQHSVFGEFFRYTTLSVLGALGVSCYILADTFFIAAGLGADGLAALNLAIPVFSFIAGTGLMLGMGGATKFSVRKSQNLPDEINLVYTNTVQLAVIFSIVFVLPGVFWPKEIAQLLGGSGGALDMTITYLRWLLLFSPAFIFNNVWLCFVRNDESPRLAMTATLVASFSNIGLDYLFIFPMNMGMFGAILATCMSPIISSCILIPHWRRKPSFHLVRTWLRKDIVKSDFSLGFPSFVSQVSYGFVMLIFNLIILGLTGNVGVAAYGVIANITFVVVSVYTGMAQGTQPLLSTAHGRNDRKTTHLIFGYAIVTGLISSVMISLCLYFFADPTASVFNTERNKQLQDLAVIGLQIYAAAVPFSAYNILLTGYLTSVERTWPAHILSLLRGFIVVIPLAYILSAIWGMTGVWWAYPAAEILVAFIGIIASQRMHIRRASQTA